MNRRRRHRLGTHHRSRSPPPTANVPSRLSSRPTSGRRGPKRHQLQRRDPSPSCRNTSPQRSHTIQPPRMGLGRARTFRGRRAASCRSASRVLAIDVHPAVRRADARNRCAARQRQHRRTAPSSLHSCRRRIRTSRRRQARAACSDSVLHSRDARRSRCAFASGCDRRQPTRLPCAKAGCQRNSR